MLRNQLYQGMRLVQVLRNLSMYYKSPGTTRFETLESISWPRRLVQKQCAEQDSYYLIGYLAIQESIPWHQRPPLMLLPNLCAREPCKRQTPKVVLRPCSTGLFPNSIKCQLPHRCHRPRCSKSQRVSHNQLDPDQYGYWQGIVQ